MREKKKRGYHGSPSTTSLAKSLHKKLMHAFGKKCFTITASANGLCVTPHNRKSATEISSIVAASCKHKYDFDVSNRRQ